MIYNHNHSSRSVVVTFENTCGPAISMARQVAEGRQSHIVDCHAARTRASRDWDSEDHDNKLGGKKA